jgi:hypothetical protein
MLVYLRENSKESGAIARNSDLIPPFSFTADELKEQNT